MSLSSIDSNNVCFFDEDFGKWLISDIASVSDAFYVQIKMTEAHLRLWRMRRRKERVGKGGGGEEDWEGGKERGGEERSNKNRKYSSVRTQKAK